MHDVLHLVQPHGLAAETHHVATMHRAPATTQVQPDGPAAGNYHIPTTNHGIAPTYAQSVGIQNLGQAPNNPLAPALNQYPWPVKTEPSIAPARNIQWQPAAAG